MATENYNEMSTEALRSLAKSRHPALVGTTWRGIYKPDLVELLEGRTTAEALLAKAGRPVNVTVGADGDASLADAIARAIAGKVQATGTDERRVQEMIDEALANVQRPTVNAISMPEIGQPVTIEGCMHRQFPQVLAWLRADVPVWLWGAAGSGKTHLARQLAKAMGLNPYVMSIDETATVNKLLGFQNLVSGEFVKGWLYEPYKNGGLVLIDEIDTGNPGVLAGLNALIANSHYMFPNGETVERHAQFRVIAAANTNGTGAVAGYVCRNRLDAATLNRFAVIEFAYDEGLELALACGIPSESQAWQPVAAAGPDLCEGYVRWVQEVRRNYGRNVLISPRASLLGVRALRAGIPVAEVVDALVFALCAADTRRAITERCGMPEPVANAQRKVA